ncbi:MAG: heavy metal translocating P-type ATPase, partial [Pseudorhizobium sp.]
MTTCCAPGTEGAVELDRLSHALPSSEELLLSSRVVEPGLRQTDLSVPGIHCGTCITTIEKALKALPEVVRARVNLSTRRVSVIWSESIDDVRTDPVLLVHTIVDATGYDAHLFADGAEADDKLQRELIRAVAVSGFAATNIMLLSVSVWSGAEASTRDLFHWISAMIAAPALVYAGRFFYQSAWTAIRHGRTNMDVPIALAITLSYAVSVWETMHHGQHAWFDATVSLLFFLLIGRTLDHIMRDRARSAISGLARLSPRGAMVLTETGGREYRPVEEIQLGDRLLVAAGERIPVDAIVESGRSDVDLSILNGESAPAGVGAGDLVQGGTLNLTGPLTVLAKAAAKDSFLAEVIALMEAAEGGRARYRRIADRAAQLYSPAVHLLALVAFFSWGIFGGDWKHAMLVAIAVLIITCPCALGLAVPVVQVVAAGRLFRNGIMVKDGSAMERLAEIDAALFDKTGTLTLGRPRLINAPGLKPTYVALAAGLAVHSRHPLSQAIYRGAGEVSRFEEVQELPGQGLMALAKEGLYRLGSRRFACGTSADDGAAPEVVLSLDSKELAVFRFEDALRPDAAAALDTLHRVGIRTGILSGDRTPVVESLARKLHVSFWQAELAPKDKVDAVAELSG